MDPILVKIFAAALTLSQVMTHPGEVTTAYDPVSDRRAVVQMLRDGCAQMRKAFDIESIPIDDLIATAMADPRAVVGESRAFKGLNFEDLHLAYRQFCKNEDVSIPNLDLADVIAYYNRAAANLPPPDSLSHVKLPGASRILDVKDRDFAELFEPNQRRLIVDLAEVPAHVQRAFISAEDKRFYEHHGVDERGVMRAFLGLLSKGRRQGGSTITQQVAKNILVGDDVTYERKIREMLTASRLEAVLSKSKILELYLNSIYFGRGAWGIEMAAEAYFDKPARALTLTEGALLAALTRGPNYYDPDKHPERAKARLAYVLNRMHEDGAIDDARLREALAAPPKTVPYVRPRREIGHHYVDQLVREAKSLPGFDNLTADSFVIHSTINVDLQRAVETALQDGLARYEIGSGRVEFQGPEMNLTEAMKRIERRRAARPDGDEPGPAWQDALSAAPLPLYDVHWTPAIVVEEGGAKAPVRVGLRDGRVMALSAWRSSVLRTLAVNDVVYVNVREGTKKTPVRAELRTRPVVQGAAVVLENATGRVLAMAGSFSYPLSQLNRTTQAQRQPGSALKPLSYLAALAEGLQPNTLVNDTPITLPPPGGDLRYARPEDYWSPKNYDSTVWGQITLRRALENSRNLATAHLLDGGIAGTPEASLDRVCGIAVEAQVYSKCEKFYPVVLGAQPVRPIDLAAFYAAIANEGARPTPYLIDSIERRGAVVYRRPERPPVPVASVDNVAFYQLKTMLQGVVARGTAASMARNAAFIAGKTGTSEEENDAWFVGFSNDVTVAVWVGYDNADGKRRTLGGGRTGGNVAVPIFDPIMRAAWETVAPRTALRGPSREAMKHMAAVQIDLHSGEPVGRYAQPAPWRGPFAITRPEPSQPVRAFTEYLRTDGRGQPLDTRYQLASRTSLYETLPEEPPPEYSPAEAWFRNPFGGFTLGPAPPPSTTYRSAPRLRYDIGSGWVEESPPPVEEVGPPPPQRGVRPLRPPGRDEVMPRTYPGRDLRPPARVDRNFFRRF